MGEWELDRRAQRRGKRRRRQHHIDSALLAGLEEEAASVTDTINRLKIPKWEEHIKLTC